MRRVRSLPRADTGLSLRATYWAVDAGHIPHLCFGQRILIQTPQLSELLGLTDTGIL